MDLNPYAAKRSRRDNITGWHEQRDMFADLANSVLVLIISFLPFKDAIKTSAISRKWRGLFRFVKDIEFKESFFSGLPPKERRIAFITFMRQWIEACAVPTLDRVELALSNADEFSSNVDSCISFALGRQVNHLGLDFSNGDESGTSIDLPDRVYEHTDLRSVKLFSCRFQEPMFRKFVALKNVAIGQIELNTSTMSDLLDNCPALESLSLEKCWTTQQEGNVRGKHRSLENLTVDRCNFASSYFEFHAPNLKAFKYTGDMILLELDFGRDIQEVELDFSPVTEFEGFGDVLYMLMLSLADAKRLTVCTFTLQVIPSGSEPIGMEFPMCVTHLILKTAMHPCDFWGISFFLKSCPLLETLTFEITSARVLPDYESAFPSCPHEFCTPMGKPFKCFLNMKVVEVKGFKGNAMELNLLKLLMRHGRAMRNLTLYTRTEATSERTFLVQRAIRELMGSPRSSTRLQFKIVTGYNQ